MVIENDLYRFYDENLQLIKANLYDEVTLILIILRKFCQIVGIDLIINQCVFCGNKKLKTISFKHQGMLCNNCSQEFKAMIYDINVSKLFHSLFNNQYAKLSLYHQDHSFAIKLLKNYISDSSGIFLNTLGEY
jgi:DNA repair protein RecO